MSEAETLRMRLTDAIHLVEQHVDQVVTETGLSRFEAYKLVQRQSAEVAKRIGVEQRRVRAISADGQIAELGRS
jgi:hypothetical protein